MEVLKYFNKENKLSAEVCYSYLSDFTGFVLAAFIV